MSDMFSRNGKLLKKESRRIVPLSEQGQYQGPWLPQGEDGSQDRPIKLEWSDSDDDTEVVINEDTDPYSEVSDSDCEVIIGGGMPGFSVPRLEPRRLVRHGAMLERRPTPMPRRRRFDELEDIEDSDEEVIEHQPKRQKERGALATRYCVTWNNPTITGEAFAAFLANKVDVKLAVFQEEKGENEVTHFQGYIELNKRMFTTGVHAMLAPYKMHLEHAKGTKIQNHVYCTKEGRTDGPWYVKSSEGDYKRKSGNQGKRTDMDNFAVLIQTEGGITDAVVEQMPGHVMAYSKHAKAMLADMKLAEVKKKELAYWQEQYAKRQRGEDIEGQQQRKLVLYFGPTAVGKTTEVKMKVMGELQSPLFEKAAGTKWWDGYNNENHVLVDEYKGGQTIDEFKALTNIGEVAIEMKGSSGVLIAESMYFTSNCHPSRWWKRNADQYENWSSPDYKAVVRRFAEVHWWNDNKRLTVLKNPGPRQLSEEWKKSWAAWQKFWEWRDAPGAAEATGDNYFTL